MVLAQILIHKILRFNASLRTGAQSLAHAALFVLSKPYWQGLGVVATIIVAIAVFYLGQQIERSRYEETMANFDVSFFLLWLSVFWILGAKITNG
ncbi:MAG: hypothetical protein AABZ77_02900, partial [Chloroflexota bacterium]